MFSVCPFLLWWLREYTHCLFIIIKSEVWTIIHCLGLGHETMVCALCLSILLSAHVIGGNFHHFCTGHWQSLGTALTAGMLPAVRYVVGDCEIVYRQNGSVVLLLVNAVLRSGLVYFLADVYLGFLIHIIYTKYFLWSCVVGFMVWTEGKISGYIAFDRNLNYSLLKHLECSLNDLVGCFEQFRCISENIQ